jgi:3'(2'), 5'-bisphosphate nucleotidase
VTDHQGAVLGLTSGPTGMAPTPPVTDCRRAFELAQEAGTLLMRLRPTVTDADVLRRRADALSHGWLLRRLGDMCPGDVVLSEEGRDDPGRRRARRVWIVDPLDGTREYGERGRSDWAVHVALWEDGELACGAVALPALSLVYGCEDRVELPARTGPLRLAVSRSRPPAFAHELAERQGATLVPMGSAGVKVAAVLRGEVDAYVHAGGQYEWDSAAPVAVARHAGLHASRLDGSPLHYNQQAPFLPDLVVARPELADRLLRAIGDVLERRDNKGGSRR